MIVLSVNSITKHYGSLAVLDGVSFEVRPGERIGLVGPNGAGKTTLLTILAGLQEPDSGGFELHPSLRLEYLEQQAKFTAGRTLWEEAHSVLDELVALHRQAEQTAHELSQADDQAEHDRLGRLFDRLQHELHSREAYHLDHHVERMLDGLGFRKEQYSQLVEHLSGGQQNRLMLGKVLLAQPDLMLLDEPSNHLDIESTEWLEGVLAESSQAMIVVSHDRYFLDKVTTRTLELFRGTVETYVGNFSAYWRQKAERLEVQRRTYERQQATIAKTEDFIRRNHYGQKHAQAEDRRKKLARIERVEPPREIAAPVMGFAVVQRSGDIVLRVEHLSKGYARPLFVDLSFDILRGQRWGILGPNGSGKTTLLRCILGHEQPDQGRSFLGTGVQVGYFDQRLSDIDEKDLLVDAVRPAGREMNEPQRRDLLARFGLTGDMVFQRVVSLSGGERNRASLARLAASNANLLVLDEPTNHLDLWARDALERSLNQFEGTVLFVSHDRYFLNRVADHLLVVEPGRFRVVEGNYDAYRFLVRRGLFAGEASGSIGKSSEPDAKKAKKPVVVEPARRKRRFPYRKVAELEAEILERETRLDELTSSLADADLHRNGQRAREVKAEISQQQEALRGLYEHWEEAVELN